MRGPERRDQRRDRPDDQETGDPAQDADAHLPHARHRSAPTEAAGALEGAGVGDALTRALPAGRLT